MFENAWAPPLQSRKDVLAWVCEQRNAKLAETHEPLNCGHNALLQDFGPDVEGIKKKFGHFKGLFD